MVAVASILVASEEATSGSVIQNAERISPASNGFSHFSCCSGLPYISSTSMLPLSGALQLNTSGARKERPVSSASGAYSKVLKRSEERRVGKECTGRWWMGDCQIMK